MPKPSARKLLVIVSSLVLMLTAFFAGGIALASASAASANVGSKSSAQSGCDKQDPKCNKGDQRDNSLNQTKVVVTVNSVSGNNIQGTVLQPADKSGGTITIITTASTIYQPDQSVVAVGKPIFVAGAVNSDGSVTAQVLGFYDPTVVDVGGVITGISGATITIEAKDSTHTIVLTANTLFVKALPVKSESKTEQKQPASRGDLQVGEIIEAHGKLNSDGSLTADTVIIVPAEANSK